MAERRTDGASAVSRGGSKESSTGKAGGTAKSSSRGASKGDPTATGGAKTGGSAETTDATKTATDTPATTEQDTRGRGSERFAAALAKAREGQRSFKKERTAAATPTTGAASADKAAARSGARRVRRARLRLTHVDPWSVMKTSFLLSIAIGIVTIVAVGIVWSVLGAAGVWESIDRAVADVAGDTGSDFAIQDYLGTSRIMGITMLLAVVDVFLITVVATLAAFLYNLAAALLGGLEVVFAEEER